MNYWYSFIILVFMASSVSAGGLVGAGLSATLGGLYDILVPLVLSVVAVVAIIILQYMGIDVIGNTFAAITFTIDMFFSILAHVSSKEENLISVAILFIVIVMFVFGML